MEHGTGAEFQGTRAETRCRRTCLRTGSVARGHRYHADRRRGYREGDPTRLYQGDRWFEKLCEATGTQAKSLIRMFGPRGNPQARNLFSVISYLQKHAGVELHVTQARGGN